MREKLFKIVSLFVLISFVFVKVVNIHSYSHISEDDTAVENCQVCEFQHQLDDDYVVTSPVYIAKTVSPTYQERKIIFTHQTEIFNTTFLGQNYNRPPPSL